MIVKLKNMLPLLGLSLFVVAVSASEPAPPVESTGAKAPPPSSGADGPSKRAVAEPGPETDKDRLILVLQTRRHRITVYGGDLSAKYTVHDAKGVLLARKIESKVLKEKFPALYEVATGVAWSGL